MSDSAGETLVHKESVVGGNALAAPRWLVDMHRDDGWWRLLHQFMFRGRMVRLRDGRRAGRALCLLGSPGVSLSRRSVSLLQGRVSPAGAVKCEDESTERRQEQ